MKGTTRGSELMLPALLLFVWIESHAVSLLPGVQCERFKEIAASGGEYCHCTGKLEASAPTFKRNEEGTISYTPQISPDSIVNACNGYCAGVKVDWGDGTVSEAAYKDAWPQMRHKYVTSGTYYVRVCAGGQFKFNSAAGSCSHECRGGATLQIDVTLPP